MPLQIQHLSLAKILSKSVPLCMARYQRHYEWGRKEMEQMLDDLAEAFDLSRERAPGTVFHFFGDLILFSHPNQHLDVVDGQQRLTSLTLLLSAARDLVTDPSLRLKLQSCLLLPAASEIGTQPRLQLHRGDQDFLNGVILPGTSAAQLSGLARQDLPGAECLRLNALLSRAALAGRPQGDIAAFAAFVLERCSFVEITVGNEDDAFRIFETVNNRGRPISSEDILRYALVEYATDDPAEREEFLARWDAMESELGPRGIKRFLSGWRTRLTKGSRPRQSLHRTVLDNLPTRAAALNFLRAELSSDLSLYNQIETADADVPDGPSKHRIDVSLRSFSLLDFDEWLPVVSHLLRHGLDKPDRLANDLVRVERLAWFYYLHRDDKGVYLDRRDHFSDLMKIVATRGTLADLPRRALLNQEQRAKMLAIPQERLDPKWIPLRSLLVRLEMALLGARGDLQRSELTIEHILPLRPSAKAWLDLYDNDSRVVSEYAQKLGNLCLVSSEINTLLGNRVYGSKRKIMAQNQIPQQSPLAADIAQEPLWTREVIARRSNWLLGVFAEVFDLAS